MCSKCGKQPVYPRVCGGTAIVRANGWDNRGLSPRVRGNQWENAVRLNALRSIPACAGEPLRWPRGRYWIRVYPRVCGGTCLLGVMC